MVFKIKKETPEFVEEEVIPEFLEPSVEDKKEDIQVVELPENYSFVTASEYLGLSSKGKELYRYTVESTEKLTVGLQE